MSEWISVKDSLPEYEQIVDVFVRYSDGWERFTAVEYYPEMKFPWQHDDLCSIDNVTHWMKLPEPPEGE